MSKKKSTRRNKNGKSGWKISLVAILVVAGGFVIWQASSFIAQPYPTYAAGVFYNNPTVIDGGTTIQLPFSFVKDKTIVFTDVPLQDSVSELEYQGRIIPLSLYKGGNYLPLIAIYTPSGNVVTGIRTCEPCGSFSMHIDEKQYLICDACETKWDIETFQGITGGCLDYPPPKLTAYVGDNIQLDLSTLGINVAS